MQQGALRARAEGVVPIVLRGSHTLDRRMEGHHGLRHGLAGGVGIEAAVDRVALLKQRAKPAGIGPGTGGRDAAELGMEDPAADGVDGRFAQDDGTMPRVGPEKRQRDCGNGKEAQVFLGSGGHAAPGLRSRSAEFGADRSVLFSPQNEDGVGSVIGVKGTGLDERINQLGDQAALMEQIVADAGELGGSWRWQFQIRLDQGGLGWRWRRWNSRINNSKT